MREFEDRKDGQAQERGENRTHQRLRKECLQSEEVAETDRDE
jgi:hypothetical protein